MSNRQLLDGLIQSDGGNVRITGHVNMPTLDNVTMSSDRVNDTTLVFSQDGQTSIVVDTSRYGRVITKTADIVQTTNVIRVGEPENVVAVFGQVASYIESDINISGNQSFDVAFWIYPVSDTINRLVAIGNIQEYTSNNGDIQFIVSGGILRYSLYGGAVVSTGIMLTVGEWTHVVITCAVPDGVLKVYINKVLTYTSGTLDTTSWSITGGQDALRIGSTGGRALMFINNGAYDSFSISTLAADRTLTAGVDNLGVVVGVADPQHAVSAFDVAFGETWSVCMDIDNVADATYFVCGDIWAYNDGGVLRVKIYGVDHTFENGELAVGRFQLTITYDGTTNTRSMYVDGVLRNSVVLAPTTPEVQVGKMVIFGQIPVLNVFSKAGQKLYYMYLFNRVMTTEEMISFLPPAAKLPNYPNATSSTTPEAWRISQVNVGWGRVWAQYDVDGIYNDNWLPELTLASTFITASNPAFTVLDQPLEERFATIDAPTFTGVVSLPTESSVRFEGVPLSTTLGLKAPLENPVFTGGVVLPDAKTITVKVPPANDATLVLSQGATTSITTDVSVYERAITKTVDIVQGNDAAAGGNYAQMGVYINSYIESRSNDIAGQASYSVAFWVYLTTNVNNVFTIGKFGVASGTDELTISLAEDTGKWYWYVDAQQIGTEQSLNVWNHIIITYDSATGITTLYRNAALIGSITKTEGERASWSIPSDSGMIRIGNTSEGASVAVNGGYYDADTISATERSLVPIVGGLQTWGTQTSAADLDWKGIAWSPELGMYAAVAETPPAALTEWTTRTAANDNQWRSIVWAPGLGGGAGRFVAVSDSGGTDRVMTSPDGIVWTTRTAANDNRWFAIAWAHEIGLFAAVAISGGTTDNVMTSPDGIVWTTRTTNFNRWIGIAWAPELGLFAAVADSGGTDRVMTSPDGITWTTRTTNTNEWRGIAWAPELGLFAAVAKTGTTDRVMTSPDGITWTTRTTNSNAWNGIAWAPEIGLFAAVAQSGGTDRVMTSPDGIVWTTRTAANDNRWWGIAWAPELGLFAAVANTGGTDRVMTSPDGITWTVSTTNSNNWFGITWAPELGLFAAVAETGTTDKVMTADLTETFENPQFDTNITITSDYYSKYWWSTDQGWEVAASAPVDATLNAAWKAFNKTTADLNDCWISSGNPATTAQTLEIKFPKHFCISSYSITSRNDVSILFPTAWKIQGSNDNGSTWTDVEALRNESVWNQNETKTYSENVNTNKIGYMRYRLLISEGFSSQVAIGEWKLYGTFAGVMTSTNGSSWTPHAAPLGKKWEAITWAPPPASKFVAVASGGTEGTRAMTSVDGYTWSAQMTPPKTLLRSIAWAPEINLLTAVGYSSDTRENPKFTSDNTIDLNYTTAYGWDTGDGWVARASSILDSISFFASNAFNKTTNGNAWHSALTTPSVSNPQWLDIEYPYPVAIQSYNITSRNEATFIWFPTQWRLQGSNDGGLTWTNLESTRLESSWNPVQTKLYTNGINTNKTAYKRYRLLIEGARKSNTDPDANYVAIANWSLFTNTSGVITSPDGVNWTPRVVPANKNWGAIAWAPPDRFAVVSYDGVTSGDRTISSPDGVSWTAHYEPYYNEWRSIAWSPQLNTFAAVASAVVKENPAFSTDNTTLAGNYSSTYGWDTNVGWVARASSVAFSGEAWKAFNKTFNDETDCWHSANTTPSVASPQWLEIEYPYNVHIISYTITSRNFNGTNPMWFPTRWRLQGSVDGTTWINMENTRFESSWNFAETKYYTDNINISGESYKRYRLLIEGSRYSTTNSTTDAVAIGNWTLFTKEDGGGVMTTPKVINWTTRASPENRNWSAITWSPDANNFVAVAYNGTTAGTRAMTSSDGTTWTSISTPVDNEWRAITWSPALAQFASVSSSGTGNRVMTLDTIAEPNLYVDTAGQFARTNSAIGFGSQWSVCMSVSNVHADGASLFTLSDKSVWAYSDGGSVRTRIAGVEHTFASSLPTAGMFQLTITYDRATNTRSLFIDGVAAGSAVVASVDTTDYSATLDIFGAVATPPIQSKVGQRLFYMYVLNRVITTTEMSEIDAFATHTNAPTSVPDGDWRIGQVNVAWGRAWTQYDINGIYNGEWLPELKLSDAFITRSGSDIVSLTDVLYNGKQLSDILDTKALATNPTLSGDVIISDRLAIGMNPTIYELQLSTDSAAKLSTSTWTTYSDERLKENIVIADYNMCFETVSNLDLKYFKWRDDLEGLGSDAAPDRHKLGWIAQEVEPIFPRAVDTIQKMFGIPNVKTVNSDQIYACMYGAVKKLIEKNAALQTSVETLQTENAALQTSVETLQTENAALQTSVETLQTENVALQTSVETLQTENAALQTSVEALQTENVALQTSVEALQTENVALQADVVDIKDILVRNNLS